jgi:hypothetical protein
MAFLGGAGPRDTGIGLRVLQNPDLFESLFPGYQEVLTDTRFWDRYFQETFDQAVLSPALMRQGVTDLLVATSWAGSADLYKKYGADILIFGPSTTYDSLPAGLLREDLDNIGNPLWQNKRVLQCGSAVYPEVLTRMLSTFTSHGKKSALSIWGYGLNHTHRAGNYELEQNLARASYKKWREDTFFDGSWPVMAVPHLSWNTILGTGIQQDRETRGHSDRLLIANDVAADRTALEGLLAQQDMSPFSLGFVAQDCDLSVESAELDRGLAEMLQFSDKVVLFLAPTAPINRRHAPSCLMENLRSLLESKASPRVIVHSGDWDSFGLDYTDFLYPVKTPGMWRIDPSHPNAAGAKKVTAEIARLAVGALTPHDDPK